MSLNIDCRAPKFCSDEFQIMNMPPRDCGIDCIQLERLASYQ